MPDIGVLEPGTGANAAAPLSGVAPFDRRVIVVGGVVFAVLMALSARYGFHRDELYFMASAQHLEASYVDQPVLAPLLAWVSLKLFGVSLAGLRLWPALAAWATVVAGGLTAREFGGGRRAQLLAAVAAATMPGLLAIDHLAGPTAFDVLAWAALALVAARIERTGEARWWLAGGVVLGLGLANKHSIGLFAVALVIGALASGGWRLVWNRWFAAGAVIAAAFTIPDLWWQAQHQWATVAMTHALNQENGGLGNIGNWVIGQLIMVTLALVWVWVAGLSGSCGGPGVRCGGRWRGRMGCCSCSSPSPPARRSTTSPGPTSTCWPPAPSLSTVGSPPGGPAPQPAAGHRGDDRRGAADRAAGAPGRRHRLDLQAEPGPGRVHRLAPARRHHPHRLGLTAVPAAGQCGDLRFDYGEAGAINVLGWGTGLPSAVSGHNTFWWWGPGNPHAITVLAVMPGPVDGGGTPSTCGSSSPACGPWPRCPTPTTSTTRNLTAMSTCAPGPASRGARCGRGCAATADSLARKRRWGLAHKWRFCMQFASC